MLKKNAQLVKDGFPNQDEIFDGFFHRALPVAVASLLGAAWEGGGGLVVNVMVVMPFLWEVMMMTMMIDDGINDDDAFHDDNGCSLTNGQVPWLWGISRWLPPTGAKIHHRVNIYNELSHTSVNPLFPTSVNIIVKGTQQHRFTRGITLDLFLQRIAG